MPDYDVIGGKADGSKVVGATKTTFRIADDQYIALEFSPDPEQKHKTTTIYMRCGMAPLEAMAIWRERNMT